ncbi:LytR/AlgR family response regulator transcription factor [Algoriphagus sp. NG3]|uniref:LytR/AlgR family response regulator transcription factor n=1 Tax=Algoriphagus sp. NG3 TaxID=3097546 RepID=UPI002A839B9B|nr:LytTR family transcriptional regulator DNA-binding domain-containing protein [Algoriphagus sp. NG3]WPR76450.1 LytTR family transcriptional regulator DNA-binding domain-containing protein [Algoriphagus sp. NG3]
MDNKKAITSEIQSNLFIRENGWLTKITIDEIEFIQTEDINLRIHLKNKQYTLKNSVKELMGKLPENQFKKVHKFYIVNLKRVETIQRDEIKINRIRIPLTNYYYKEISKNINKKTN